MTQGASAIRVLHVVTALPVGGVENMVMKVVRGYDKSRFAPSVCCIRAGGEVAEQLQVEGYRVTVLNRMQRHGFDWGVVTALRGLMEDEGIQILRTHQYHANLYGRLAGILARVPVMIPSYHSRYVSPGRPKLHRRIINRVLGRFTDAFVAVSAAVAEDLQRFDWVDAAKVKVIHNGIPLEAFALQADRAELRRRFGLPGSGTIIGTVGRLKPEKGHAALIDAAARLGAGVGVAIAGDGPLRRDLTEQAARCGVALHLPGMLPLSDIPAFLSSLDIFCYPSLWEGMATAVVEAMAAGLPVVASDIPALHEILPEDALFFPSGDAAALSREVAGLLADPARRAELGRRGREHAELFSLTQTVRAYEELFEACLKRKGIS